MFLVLPRAGWAAVPAPSHSRVCARPAPGMGLVLPGGCLGSASPVPEPGCSVPFPQRQPQHSVRRKRDEPVNPQA